MQPLSPRHPPRVRVSRHALRSLRHRFETPVRALPYRTESGDVAYAQVEGRLGPKQPYRVRLGWEWLAFEGNAAKDFSGLVGRRRAERHRGRGTIFTVTAQRQPYRSFFGNNNFYVVETVGGRVERPFQSGIERRWRSQLFAQLLRRTAKRESSVRTTTFWLEALC